MSVIQPDSPQALSRALVVLMVADAEIDQREVDALDDMAAFDLLGIERKQFLQLARQFRDELTARWGGRDRRLLPDWSLVDDMLSGVRDPRARLCVSCLAQRVITADGRVRDVERCVFDHMLCRWGLTRAEVARALCVPQQMH
jgi:uncharacterized tellurite resistance protein B-like protein